MFSGYKAVRRPRPDVEWVKNGEANVYYKGRVYKLIQLPDTSWVLAHPYIIPIRFEGVGCSAVINWLASR